MRGIERLLARLPKNLAALTSSPTAHHDTARGRDRSKRHAPNAGCQCDPNRVELTACLAGAEGESKYKHRPTGEPEQDCPTNLGPFASTREYSPQQQWN
jgi:hypothetical protein